MLSINLNRENPYPLVDQIVEGIRQQIEERELKPGSRLPSIRVFAQAYSVSRFTVVEAYDRLVAQGYLHSRRGAGFFTTSKSDRKPAPVNDPGRRNEEMVWLIRRLLTAKEGTMLAGGPWLPDSWLDDSNIRRAMRALAGKTGNHFIHYGNPRGYSPLRRQIAEVLLPDIGINADESQVLLTTGASQALDIIARRLLKPGDTVLVDDPGYYNLFGSLRVAGMKLIGVPRIHEGPDTNALEALASEHRPKLYYTQSVLQNPTGTNMAPHVAYRILQVANKYGFHVVEDDIFSDLEHQTVSRLAALDQLERVIYIRSFSKTLSGSIRVGFIASTGTLVQEFEDLKMVTGITSSILSEALVHHLLADGHYRKFIIRIREKLSEARGNVSGSLEGAGVEFFNQPESGMFLWGRFPNVNDSLPLAERALRDGLLLAPGTVFRPNLQSSPWLRFNVAVCDEPATKKHLLALAGNVAGVSMKR